MSVVTTRTLHCDGLDCEHAVEGNDGETTAELRAMARGQGWSHRKGVDLCEPCTSKS